MFWLVASLLSCHSLNAQTLDSATAATPTRGALQFQLVGGLGVNYFAPLGNSSSLRLGADVAFKHGHSDATYDEHALLYPMGPTISWGYPEADATSYEFTVSGLYIQALSEFMNTSLYCGVGPSASFSFSKTLGNIDDRSMTGASFNSVTGTSENKSTVRGIGGLALLGAKARIIERISLSAELCFSALYQWSNTSLYSETRYFYSEGSSSQTFDSRSSSSRGWSTAVSNIRVGLLIGI